MIELMLYENQKWFILCVYAYVGFLFCKVVRDSVNQLEEREVDERYDEFIDIAKAMIDNQLWSAVKDGRIYYQDAKTLGSNIIRFYWL